VIGIPIETQISGGLDSILSIIQMPAGVPVGAMPAGKAGGTNAALYAISILASSNQEYANKLDAYRRATAEKIAKKNESLQKEGIEAFIKKIEGTK